MTLLGGGVADVLGEGNRDCGQVWMVVACPSWPIATSQKSIQ